MRHGENHRNDDRRSEDGKFEDVTITNKQRLSVKKGPLIMKIMKLRHHGTMYNIH